MKKNYKKTLLIIISLLLTVSLVACADYPLRDQREDYDYEMGYRDYDGSKMDGWDDAEDEDWEEEDWEEEPEEEIVEEPVEEEPTPEPTEEPEEPEPTPEPTEEPAESGEPTPTPTPEASDTVTPTPSPTPTPDPASDDIPQSGQEETQQADSNTQENTDQNGSQSNDGKYRVGEKWEVDGQWSLVVNSVLSTNERDESSGDEPAAVYIVDYTYRNLGYTNPDDGSGLIFWLDDDVTDSQGYMGYGYDLGLPYEPQEVGAGESYNAQICIAVDNNGPFDINVVEYDSNDEYREAIFHIEP